LIVSLTTAAVSNRKRGGRLALPSFFSLSPLSLSLAVKRLEEHNAILGGYWKIGNFNFRLKKKEN
jgi:hypothetical protein